MPDKALDTNILIYAYAADTRSAIATQLLRRGGVISVQNLNEFVNIVRRKLRFSWQETTDAIDDLLALLSPPVSLTFEIHLLARQFAQRYHLAIYDALIVAAAFYAGCDTLYSEDMHAGLLIEDRLRIINPFG